MGEGFDQRNGRRGITICGSMWWNAQVMSGRSNKAIKGHRNREKRKISWKCFESYRNPIGFRQWVKVAKNQKLLYTHGMGTWKSKNRHKYLLQYDIIFVCKYRKKLLVSRQISDDIKQFSYEICQRHSVIIRYMEKISPIFTKTILERTYLLDRWIFCM